MPTKSVFIALFVASLSLQAGIIDIASDLVNESNDRTAANVFITPVPAWAIPPAGAGWISYAETGIGPGDNSSNQNVNSWTVFTENFYLPGPMNTGSVKVWADDAAYALLDGIAVGPNPDVVKPAKKSSFIGPKQDEFAEIDLSGLSQGAHSLTFSVYQAGNGPFGLLYSGSINSIDAVQTAAQAPEPSAFLLLGAGLLGVAAVIRRRKAS